MFPHITTIDGTASAGKTTMAKLLAAQFRLTHLESGSIFRALTKQCINKGVDFSSHKEIIDQLTAEIHLENGRIFLNGEDVTDSLRDPIISKNVCFISYIPEVRKYVKDFQLACAKKRRVICDGRKSGTEIFPHANIKFYLTANLEIRAIRRYHQLIEAKKIVTFSEVYKDLKERENQERSNGLLAVPRNAIIIDNSELTIEETQILMESYMN